MFFKPPVVSESEVEFVAIRAQGAGGQNVNKVSSAVHLRFDVRASEGASRTGQGFWPFLMCHTLRS